jgi:phosphatidylinositol alpha-1,6-mannosyltransferase
VSRTLIVTNDFPPRTGGIESFVLAMARLLPPDEVVVHTARQTGDQAYDARLGFEVVRDRSPVMVPTPAISRRVAATARRCGCDRVWFGAAAPLGLMAPTLRRAGVRRTVATTHGHEIWWSSLPGSRSALRAIGERNDVLTYLGEYCRQRISRPLTPTARSRLRQLTPGVDSDTFVPGAGDGLVRRRYGLGHAPVIVCVSRMVARKGQDMLVRALPGVRAAVPGARLLLVGDGPHRRAVENAAARAGVADAVTFTGRVPWQQTPAMYAAGDVFAMPTRTRLGGLEPEALGICYLEAAATGLPVIAGDSGGAPDAVRDGENGFVVDGRNLGELTARIVQVLTDPELAARFGSTGRARVRDQWGWRRQAGILRELLDPDRPLTG